MPPNRLDAALSTQLELLNASGTAKGDESVIVDVMPPSGEFGRRYQLEGEPKPFLRVNSNSYLGLSHHPAVIGAEETATGKFGAGPGAVRFISGTYAPHRTLEQRLAGFHGREAAVIYSSAYAAVISTLTSLINQETVIFSDELNHNCIINGLRMSRPGSLHVYKHLDYDGLENALKDAVGAASRCLVVTDGVFSMRGDFADLSRMENIARSFDDSFDDGVVLVVDDSHGVGAFGATGHGTEEVSAGTADILIGTLGKAFGVNGGYVAGSQLVTYYLRERGPMYIYSNPITVGEAAAATRSIDILDSQEGEELLRHLAEMTARFEGGLVELGLETIPGPHPVVPLMVRDTEKTTRLVAHLFQSGVLATGLNFPVVPKGDEEIRFQINADHTSGDIDYVLDVLGSFSG